MKKILLALCLLPAAVFAQTKGFTLTGKVEGLADGTVKITSTQDPNQAIASAEAKAGSFVLNGSVPEPGLYFLVMNGEQPQYIFLENKAININGSKADIKHLAVEGSTSHKDFEAFRSEFDPLFNQLNILAADLQRAPDEAAKGQIMQRFDSVASVVNKTVDRFIVARPSSFVSPMLLTITAQLNRNPLQLEASFNQLAPEVRSSALGKQLAQLIAAGKVGTIGSDALEFSQADTAGKAVSLSSFRGKYVLVDFWASWCRPCRLENPNLVKAFQKFKNKNFTVLGISLDQDKAAWVKAIEKDKLTWTQLSDLQQWNNAVAQMYHVQSIPQNFLIDPQGKIVAKDLRGEDLEKKLCELLGCK